MSRQQAREAAAAYVRSDDCPLGAKMIVGYDIEPLVKHFERAILAAKQDALEQAARVCERYVTPYGRAGSVPSWDESIVRKQAAAIRALTPDEGEAP